jgi:hypothetical protein
MVHAVAQPCRACASDEHRRGFESLLRHSVGAKVNDDSFRVLRADRDLEGVPLAC